MLGISTWRTSEKGDKRIIYSVLNSIIFIRAIFLHVALPGQTPGSVDLGNDYNFPTMDAIGLQLVTVLDHLRVKQVVGLGDGAGANIMLRFGMHHPTRVHGIIAINTDGIESAGFQEILSRRKSVNHEELNNK